MFANMNMVNICCFGFIVQSIKSMLLACAQHLFNMNLCSFVSTVFINNHHYFTLPVQLPVRALEG